MFKRRIKLFEKIRALLYTLMLMIIFSLLSLNIYGQAWIDNTFEDFSKGELDASGQNIYVSKQGKIQTIRRFDLNNDGFIDLLFNNTHNDDVSVPASLATVSSNREVESKTIHIEGSLAADVVDLNKDGYPDLVFTPNSSGVQGAHRYISIVYGGEDGWPRERTNGLLPVNGVKSVIVVDLNGDSWPDIITLNSNSWLPGQPEGNIARIYWGGKHGFMLTQYKDIGVGTAFKMAQGDFDSDGVQDIAFLTQDNTVEVLWGNGDALNLDANVQPDLFKYQLPGNGALSIAAGDIDSDDKTDLIIGSGNNSLYILKGKGERSWETPIEVPNVNASSIAVGDLDNDGQPELLISYFSLRRAAGGEMLGGRSIDDSGIKVLWNNAGSFSSSQSTLLDAPYTVATGIVDLDGDGRMDIVCATHQGEKTYETESIIYFGNENRKFERSKKGIPSSGAYHVAVIPSKESQNAKVVISNNKRGNLNEEVPLLLYYGSSEGFKEDNKLEIPFTSGYESSAADLNGDGYVDLISINSMHGGGLDDPYRGVNIFWGGEDGYDFEGRRTVLNEENASTSNVADLNQDGYLDIVVGFFDRTDKSPTELVVYYGSEEGYESRNRVTIPSEGRSTSPTIGDFNNDGWLDIAVSSYSKDMIRIFWGGSTGFNENNQQVIQLPSVIDLETADLNNDGYLDLIASSYKDKVNDHYDSGVMLFWGGPNGFTEWNAQWLPSSTVLGPVVADFDNDGHLDLFFPSYHADNTRESLPMYLYWGGKEGYSFDNKSIFIGDSGTDALAADFNKDGLIDLAIASHADNGSHSKAISKVYYNDGMRFSSANIKVDSLPSPGTHWMWNYDMGHVFHRKSTQKYISSIKEWKKQANRGELFYEAEVPAESNINFYVRHSSAKEKLDEADWEMVKAGKFLLDRKSRYLQYRVNFSSDNGDAYPVLNKVSIKLD